MSNPSSQHQKYTQPSIGVGITPYEYICQQWQQQPERFILDPSHHSLGLYTYRILKACNLVTSPVLEVVSAKEVFDNPTTRVNELWHTDFTQLKVVGWGWYYMHGAG